MVDFREEGPRAVTRKAVFKEGDLRVGTTKADTRVEGPQGVHRIQASAAEDQPQETVKAVSLAGAPRAAGATGNRNLANGPVPKGFKERTEKKAAQRSWFSKMPEDLPKASC
jgi:hypothetical protein